MYTLECGPVGMEVSPRPFEEEPRLWRPGQLSDLMIVRSLPNKVIRAQKHPEAHSAKKVGEFETVFAEFDVSAPSFDSLDRIYRGQENQTTGYVRVFQIVDRLNGLSLDRLQADAERRPDDPAVMALVWDLVGYYENHAQTEQPFIDDVKLSQFSFGNTESQPGDSIRYHDLDFTQKPFSYKRWLEQFARIAGLVRDTEATFKLNLAEHRQAVSDISSLVIQQALDERCISSADAQKYGSHFGRLALV